MSEEQSAAEAVPDAAADEAPPRRRRRRWPWVLLVLPFVLVGALLLALPTLVERGAAYGSRYWLGLPARIDNVDLSLLDGTLVLEGVSVGSEPDGVEPTRAALDPPPIDATTALLHLDRISAHLSWEDLRAGTIRLSSLSLETPSVRVIRESDGAIDPLRHARPLAPPSPVESQPATKPPSEPWPVLVDSFALSAPTVVIVDPPSGEKLLEFSLDRFGLDNVAATGSQFSLGGVGIEGPVLRVRRDLVFASPSASRAAAPPSAAAPGVTPPAAAPGDGAAASTGASASPTSPVAETLSVSSGAAEPAAPAAADQPSPVGKAPASAVAAASPERPGAEAEKAAAETPPAAVGATSSSSGAEAGAGTEAVPAAATADAKAATGETAPAPAAAANASAAVVPTATVPVAATASAPVAAQAPAPTAVPAANAPAATQVPAPVTQPADAPTAAQAPAPSTSASSTTATANGFRIEKIDIAGASFVWVTDKGPLKVALTLKASDITADQGKHFPVDLQLEIDKGHIGLVGDVGILPPSYKGKLAWRGLPFPPLLLASLPELAAWLHSADSTGDLDLDVDAAGAHGPPALHMSGHATIETLDIANPGQREVALGWKQLEVGMKEVLVPLAQDGKHPRTTVANLELVKLTEPNIRYTHPSPSLRAALGLPPLPPADAAKPGGADAKAATGNNSGSKTGDAKPKASDAKTAPNAAKARIAVSKSAAGAAKAPVADAKAGAAETKKNAVEAKSPADDARNPAKDAGAAAASPVDLTITTLELDGGDMEVIDTTVSPAVTSTVKDLFVIAHDVHFPDPQARAVEIRALLPKDSVLKIAGDLRPGNNGDFTVSLQKFDLPMYSPYASAAGASLDAGQASVETKVKLRGPLMQIDNELVLREFGVSLRDPSSFDRDFGMPIDLALALLRDPAGNIRLTIPVKIDDKGTEVSTGAIIASALKAALIGAVTSPLKLLGGAFGGVESAVGGMFSARPLGSRPGTADLDADSPARMEGLVKLLADRPAMGLVLRGRVGPADSPVVAEQLLLERIKAGKGFPDVEGSGLLARRRLNQAVLARDKGDPQKKTEALVLSPDDEALYERCVAAVTVPPDRLDALAKARADGARALLLARGADAKRVAVGAREADGDPGVVLSIQSSQAALVPGVPKVPAALEKGKDSAALKLEQWGHKALHPLTPR